MKFQQALIATILKDSDVFKIKSRSTYDEGRKEWSIPSFLLNDKKADVSFPTINARQRVDEMKEQRQLQFEDDDSGSQGRKLGNFHGNSTATDSIYPSGKKTRLDDDKAYQTKSDFGGGQTRISHHKDVSPTQVTQGGSMDMIGDRRKSY